MFIVLDDKFTDLITGNVYSGKIEIQPYGVAVLKKGKI